MAGRRSTLRRRLRRWRGGVWRRALPALLAASAAVPASAGAAGWDPPRELSGPGSAPLSLAATAGLDARGDAVVLWHAGDGVESVVRAAGHGFGRARAIRGSRLSMPDLRPRLAFDPQGGALAVWSYFEPHPRFVADGYSVDYTFGLRVASRGPRGAFGSAQTLTGKLDADPSADIAIDQSGTAVVIWTDEAGMHAAARPRGRRRFQHAQVISQNHADPQVGVGASGSAVAAWTAGRSGAWSVRAAVAADGGFGRAARLPIEGLGDAKPVIAVDGRSAVTAAWSAKGRVMAATCAASGRCGRAHPLSPPRQTAGDPHVAVAPDGSAIVAWRAAGGVFAALRHGHGSFARAAALAAPAKGESTTGLAVSASATGDAAAVWTVHGPHGDRVVAALRHAHHRFAQPKPLTADVPGAGWSDPQIVLGRDGGALAVWGALIDGHPSIEGAGYSR